jgi:AP2 domain
MGEHIDRYPLDNRRVNLRIAARGDLDNKQNLGPYETNTTGFRDVTRRKKDGRYIAQCMLNYRQHYLGTYDTAEEAAEAAVAFRAAHMPFSEDAAA